jgi:hypothetical protein
MKNFKFNEVLSGTDSTVLSLSAFNSFLHINYLIKLSDILYVLDFFDSMRDWSQGLLLAGQVFLSYAPGPFAFSLFFS